MGLRRRTTDHARQRLLLSWAALAQRRRSRPPSTLPARARRTYSRHGPARRRRIPCAHHGCGTARTRRPGPGLGPDPRPGSPVAGTLPASTAVRVKPAASLTRLRIERGSNRRRPLLDSASREGQTGGARTRPRDDAPTPPHPPPRLSLFLPPSRSLSRARVRTWPRRRPPPPLARVWCGGDGPGPRPTLDLTQVPQSSPPPPQTPHPAAAAAGQVPPGPAVGPTHPPAGRRIDSQPRPSWHGGGAHGTASADP